MVPFGITATNFTVEFYPLRDSPGQAQVIGGTGQAVTEMFIEDAEVTKINHDRKIATLEPIDEMPVRSECVGRGNCRRCTDEAVYRCSLCRTFYCSKACQQRDWKTHVFVCRVANRPNNVDFLNCTIRRIKREMTSGDAGRIYNGILYLLADDHICNTFGFKNCVTDLELTDLVCLYSTVLSTTRPANQTLQRKLELGILGEFLESFCQMERRVAEMPGRNECPCVTWFLARRTSEDAFLIPSIEEQPYGTCVTAALDAMQSLQLTERFEHGPMLNKSRSDVYNLFVAIQPYTMRLPDVRSSLWTKFGFCYCTTFDQRITLATNYLSLLEVATFDEIVSAYETATLFELMRRHKINISSRMQGTRPISHADSEDGVFRLMIGVEHALSGNFCHCFKYTAGRRCYSYFETHLDREADGNFGFHMVNTWERWQLLNFYKHVFALPGFDPQKMAEARRDPDPNQLERYLDTLVPDTRTKLFDISRCHILFPKFRGRVRVMTADGRRGIPGWHDGCDCKRHDVLVPRGLASC